MKRLPVGVFATLVVATIAAVFITQHLKSNTPLITGITHPPAFSDTGDGCRHRTFINFYLLHQSDTVSVYVVDANGNIVQQVASDVRMIKPTPKHAKTRKSFYWNGRESNGQLAPNGTYHFRVALEGQGRSVDLPQYPVVVDSVPPHLVITGVTPSQLPAPGGAPATVRYTGSNGRGGYLIIYRTGLAGPPQKVDARRIPFTKASSHGYTKTWNGLVHGRPAPAGTYVMALQVTNRACVTGTFPAYLPPQEGTTPHAGVTVSYLAAEPPLDPVPAGSATVVGVVGNERRYHWALRGLVAARKPIAHGAGTSTSLTVRLPGRSAGLYELAIRAGGQRAVVPMVARARASAHRILVVLPALTWQGENLVDDNFDGFPNTLSSGGPVVLHRPYATGLPAGFGGEAALLAHLDRAGMPYDLTTDVALADGSGPKLAGHTGVVFAGPEQWLPAALAPALRSYVEQGGKVLALGAGSLQRTAVVKQTPAGPQALDPSAAAATDVLGARREPLVTGNAEAIVRIRDELGIFDGTSGTFTGFGSFEPIVGVTAPGGIVSEAGTASQTPSIVGYRLGSGVVVDVGLPAFTASLAHNVDSQELLRRLWTILSR
ncbi:MAG TPA: N,N-dimethylformamidase beta subunit family domain-containing protein [Solirubrobacteraceae bacterium]|nr:N,N-dimethylformamidase beta subunit family domain-containing protein [Solirubrobacteraceae bacterium]